MSVVLTTYMIDKNIVIISAYDKVSAAQNPVQILKALDVDGEKRLTVTLLRGAVSHFFFTQLQYSR